MTAVRSDAANYSNANLTNANLQSATLTGSIVEGADFSFANVSQAKLDGFPSADRNLFDKACISNGPPLELQQGISPPKDACNLTVEQEPVQSNVCAWPRGHRFEE